MNSKGKTLILVVAVVAATSLATGCSRNAAYRMEYLRQSRDTFAYNSVKDMRYAQKLNPEAGMNRKVVTGLEAQVARNIQDGYQKSFVKADPSQRRAGTVFLGLQGVSND